MHLNPFAPFTPYLKPYRWWIAGGLVLLLGVQAISTTLPMVLKWAIDAAQAELAAGSVAARAGRAEPGAAAGPGASGGGGDMAVYAGIIAGLALLQWLLSIGMRWLLTGVSRFVERDIRQLYVRRLLGLPLAFFQQQKVGDLVARATNDVEAIQRFLHHAFRMSLVGVLTFLLSLALMCAIDWELALLAVLPMPLMALTARWVAGKVRRGFRQVQEQFAAMSARIQENLAGIGVVKAFALRAGEVERFAVLNQEYVNRNRRLVNIRSLFFPFAFLLNGLSMVVILWLGGLRVIEGTLSLGAFVAFNAYLIRMGRPMMMLGRIVDEYQRAVASLRRIRAVLDAEPQDRGLVGEHETPIQGEIEFRHTHFAYDGRTVLEDIDVRVPAGATLAVVGRVGSGKTTLARLIPRLIQAGSGQVLIDGVPLEEIPLERLRASIGYVPQDTFLFSDSLRENIALGAEGGDGTKADKAANAARLSADLQSFPDGLETLVGERGVTLSGGQKQRTALARALVREPRILILDDALASVDTRTEGQILERLRQITAARTTVIIAHRISTVKDADQIVVLDGGRIAERGTHEQLISRHGIYAEMFRRQHLMQELGEL